MKYMLAFLSVLSSIAITSVLSAEANTTSSFSLTVLVNDFFKTSLNNSSLPYYANLTIRIQNFVIS